MIGSAYMMQAYTRLFSSPVSSHRVSTYTNLMYGGTVHNTYSRTFSRAVKAEVSSFLSSLNSSMKTLGSSAKSLTASDGSSIFDRKIVSSSDSKAVTGSANSKASIQTYNINVLKVAQAQINKGFSLESGAATQLSEGTHKFSISVGDNEPVEVSFDVSAGQSNKTVLTNMASAINSKKLGITATVVSDEETNTSHLQITSDRTGTDSAFSITQLEGDAVEKTGIETVSTEARNAEYTVNDSEVRYSQENTVDLDRGNVKMHFNSETGKNVEVRVHQDAAAITSRIKDFIDEYNHTIDSLAFSSKDFKGAEDLGKEFARLSEFKSVALSSVGIDVHDDGSLSVDDEKLRKALESSPERVRSILAGASGVATRAGEISNRVLTSPQGKYAVPNSLLDNNDTFYTAKATASRLLYNQNMFRGMFINLML